MKEFAANLVRTALPEARVNVSDAALDGFNGVTVHSESGRIWIITRSYNMEDVFVVSAPTSDPFNTIKTRVDSVEEAVDFIVAEDKEWSAK
jgi:hypothetical protein